MSDLNLIKPKTVQNIINKFCMTIGIIPSSYKLGLTFEEQILSIGRYLEETIFPALNNNAEALLELQNLFIDLKNYVNNYFDDLDVQQEINKKLDEMAENGELSEIIEKYLDISVLKIYKTVNNLKETDLTEGTLCKTLNYNDNDRNGAYYVIVSSNNKYGDSSDILLNNGLYARLILTGTNINPALWGVPINSETLKECFEYIEENYTNANIVFNKENYNIKLNNYLNFPAKFSYDLGNNTFEVAENANLIDNHILGINSKDGINWDVQYGGLVTKIKNAIISATNYKTNDDLIFGINLLNRQSILEGLIFQDFNISINKQKYYTDLIKISNCDFYTRNRYNQEYYQIYISANGDGLEISNCHCWVGDNYRNGVSRNFIYLWNNAGGIIENIINGNIFLGSCEALSIENSHFERGNIEARACKSLTIKNCLFNYFDNLNKIIINRINSYSRSYSNISIENVIFNVTDEVITHSNVYDIICDLSNISIKNCCRRYTTALLGLKLGLIDDTNIITDFTDFNLKSAYYSDNCFIANKIIITPFMYHLNNQPMVCDYSLNEDINFDGQNGTYYYKSIVFSDNNRLIGQGMRTEKSIKTNGEAINISNFYNNGVQNTNLRIFRGTSPNEYTQYVDIPIKYGTQLIDFGTNVSGFYWKTINNNENPSNINWRKQWNIF